MEKNCSPNLRGIIPIQVSILVSWIVCFSKNMLKRPECLKANVDFLCIIVWNIQGKFTSAIDAVCSAAQLNFNLLPPKKLDYSMNTRTPDSSVNWRVYVISGRHGNHLLLLWDWKTKQRICLFSRSWDNAEHVSSLRPLALRIQTYIQGLKYPMEDISTSQNMDISMSLKFDCVDVNNVELFRVFIY